MCLQEKLRRTFPNETVFKSPEHYGSFSGMNLPSFIKDWLVNRYTSDNGELNRTELQAFIREYIPMEKSNIKARLRTQREEVKILVRIIVNHNILKDRVNFAIPDLGIKENEGLIPDYIARHNPELQYDGEVWGVCKLTYVAPNQSTSKKGEIHLIGFRPFKPYKVDLDYYRKAREKFSLDEWIDVLIRAMEYNPDYDDPINGFASVEIKHLFLSRLLVFVEPQLNMIELAPKGTGKSYIFNNISKYGWLVSGGVVSRAKMFYDISRQSPGIINSYDFVALDEVETIKFTSPEELLGAFKSYLEDGTYSVARYRGKAEAGMMLLGNIPLGSNRQPTQRHYFKSLPEFFHSSALVDRFHGFIEGWRLIRMNEDLKLSGFTLNVEYFSEILHALRTENSYSNIVNHLLHIPEGSAADTRDTKAIKRICTGYFKLFFPHILDSQKVDKALFHDYCLMPAIEKRRIIKRQLSLLDQEFTDYMPKIEVR